MSELFARKISYVSFHKLLGASVPQNQQHERTSNNIFEIRTFF